MTKIEKQVALITGGTRGIGLEIARALLARGVRVFLCGRAPSGVDEVVAELAGSYPGMAGGTVCDVRDDGQVRSMFDVLRREFGGLDVLVNNAGVGSFTYVEKMLPDEWRNVIETNLSGMFYCCREAIPMMKVRGGGYIINIGSLAGKNAFPGAAAYNASKFGLIGFSEALMQEVRHDGIRVSYLMPGSVNTDFGQSAAEDPSQTWKLLPEDVASVLIQLLESDPRALISRVEIRPSRPRKG